MWRGCARRCAFGTPSAGVSLPAARRVDESRLLLPLPRIPLLVGRCGGTRVPHDDLPRLPLAVDLGAVAVGNRLVAAGQVRRIIREARSEGVGTGLLAGRAALLHRPVGRVDGGRGFGRRGRELREGDDRDEREHEEHQTLHGGLLCRGVPLQK